ncbi:hypothetical protein [Novosphingobium pentaromativorans]|uniref:Beta-lactamase-like protein n=1 Tax=Novosphingobium pentaromativorans US6-1 TaxID=1088721 RepID=G6EHW2_9SPHN|nr:hypothetical protein [Novosphingobium pentaromativorans]AIT78604.1 beta-lactamase [Novosphingobium pentaromativorans US6-1]EHJ59096.1 beta-lactamase-like protein [Novosphingobium pentaromativorans US6-1]
MTPRLNLLLLALILIIGVPYYWFQLDADRDGAKPKPLSIAQLRSLAESIPGQKPTGVNYEQLGFRFILSNKLAAGTGLRPARSALRAYELIVPGEGPITIDCGTTSAAAERYNVRNYDRMAERRINRAAQKASLSLLLVDHPLHNGDGGFGSPRARTMPATNSDAPHAVAPGVVVIPLPGLTVGSNMVYTRLEDGREFLFTGDAAMIDSSWQDVLPPARIVTNYLRPRERTEIVSWLMTINALASDAPHMTVITGHEPGTLTSVKRGFTD